MGTTLREIVPLLAILLAGVAGVGTSYVVMSNRMTTVEVWSENFRAWVVAHELRVQRDEEQLNRLQDRMIRLEERLSLREEQRMLPQPPERAPDNRRP